jgi:Holliday junction resolvase RusA-like endonuclease
MTREPDCILRVIGTPAPQGSKRHVGNGVMIESSRKVKPWREAVCYAARELSRETFPDAVHVEMTFTLKKPASAGKKVLQPSKKPDLSKLIRSTEDALTDAGIWQDDARVVECIARKVFPFGHADALDVPGVVVRIWNAGPVQAALVTA